MIYGEELGAGGISTKTIPPQGLNLTLKGGNGKIDCTFTGITSQWLYLGQYYRLIAKPGSAPTSPMDGVQVKDVQVGAIGDAVISASIEGLTNGVQYYVRLYVRGDNGWQTSVDAVGTATPLAGIEISALAVGNEVKLNLGGVPYNHLVVHHGNPDPTKYVMPGSSAWLLIKDIYEQTSWTYSAFMNYPTGAAQTYIDGTYFNLFDAGIQSQAVEVKIPYYAPSGSSSGTDHYRENGALVRSFLLSYEELGVNASAIYGDNGTKLDYFSGEGSSAANDIRVAKYNGTAGDYFTRTPAYRTVHYIYKNGSAGSINATSNPTTKGIRPAFILPSDFLLNPEPNADGSYSPLAA